MGYGGPQKQGGVLGGALGSLGKVWGAQKHLRVMEGDLEDPGAGGAAGVLRRERVSWGDIGRSWGAMGVPWGE